MSPLRSLDRSSSHTCFGAPRLAAHTQVRRKCGNTVGLDSLRTRCESPLLTTQGNTKPVSVLAAGIRVRPVPHPARLDSDSSCLLLRRPDPPHEAQPPVSRRQRQRASTAQRVQRRFQSPESPGAGRVIAHRRHRRHLASNVFVERATGARLRFAKIQWPQAPDESCRHLSGRRRQRRPNNKIRACSHPRRLHPAGEDRPHPHPDGHKFAGKNPKMDNLGVLFVAAERSSLHLVGIAAKSARIDACVGRGPTGITPPSSAPTRPRSGNWLRRRVASRGQLGRRRLSARPRKGHCAQ